MASTKLNQIADALKQLLGKEFEFNGISVKLSFAKRVKHPKNRTIDTHFHPWYEFNYVSSGSLFTTINGREFFITKGQSYIIPPGVLHSHRGIETGDEGICIRFSLEKNPCAALLNTSDNMSPNISPGTSPHLSVEKFAAASDFTADSDKSHIHAFQSDIIGALSAPHPKAINSGIDDFAVNGSIYRIQAEFIRFLINIYEDIKPRCVASADTQTSSFSSQVIMYLEKYCETKIKSEDIAKALNTSYRTLARKFKSETGITVSEKLTRIRTEKAKQLLISTDLSMYDIAQKTGFENEYYFSLRFKQTQGVPPGVYRSRQKLPDINLI